MELMSNDDARQWSFEVAAFYLVPVRQSILCNDEVDSFGSTAWGWVYEDGGSQWVRGWGP